MQSTVASYNMGLSGRKIETLGLQWGANERYTSRLGMEDFLERGHELPLETQMDIKARIRSGATRLKDQAVKREDDCRDKLKEWNS